jgi:hypothetical protein
MNLRHRTGYGVYDLSRQVARRLQQEWEAVESPAAFRRPAAADGERIRIGREKTAGKEKRPLAA